MSVKMGYIAVIASGIILSVTACGGGNPARTDPSSAAVATTPSTPTGSSNADVAAFEKFSGLTLPTSANHVTMRSRKDAAGQPEYRVTFEMPSAGTGQFCSDGGMGGQLRVSSVPASLASVFDYSGSSQALAICQASLPGDWDVQRRVLVVGTDQPTATVQVVAFRMGR